MRLSSLLLLSLALIIQYIKSNELRDSNNAADDPKSYDPSKIELVEENLEKSVLDDYQYRVIKLPNGVEVALASDPNALISSVTAAVRVGNKNDPKDFPGMAHLCEHLLFMGTKKYPKENEHVAYAMERGGNFNAFTALGRTVYMSEIHPKYQYQQLDRLAQFFIEPLFREEIIELETHSINSEFEMYFTQTLKARFQLFNHALSHTGKFPVFTTGNRQTLFSEPRARNASTKQALQDFFNKHYVSRNIKVAVCGNESLDVLQEWVATTFGRIPDRGPTDIQDTDPFADMPSYHFTYYNPFVSNLLTLAFMVPSMGVHYKSTPMHYLDYVFSYLGSDAPLYRLAIRDLASDIDIIVVPYSDNYDIVLVSFDLLDYGRAMPVEVIIEFFRCLQFFKEYGVNKDVFEDIMNAQRGQFKYSPKKSPPGVTEALALNLLHENLPRKHLLNKQIIKEYDEDEFNELFSALQPDKFVSFINLPGKTYNLTEPYYNVTYQRALHKETLIELLKRVKAPTKVQFPPKNIYITINSPITMEKLNSVS
ncbi:hypothetical protein T552_02968 [Pneumocystis carinii B80]|uniref:Peptidase M16 N-terminal domain-containing protein n=1 Tax=Pneumocystis carinii (strain B80) TaxID=1408658 RepID=A0A0W4ZCE1_PNEC8|nr:hypothetical protein T552_02968 [Pneumocystis carinii B80]KTW26075.1 hypothetical protein T552_02968 [Pneumocystis carinii B80]